MDGPVLVINDAQSATEILRTITRFARVFTRSPIIIARVDRADDRPAIAKLMKKYGFSAAPALITPNGAVIGVANICKFLTAFAQHTNGAQRTQRDDAQPVRDPSRDNADDVIDAYRTGFADTSDAARPDDDGGNSDGDDRPSAADMSRRIEEYRTRTTVVDPHARARSRHASQASSREGRAEPRAAPRAVPRAAPRVEPHAAPRAEQREAMHDECDENDPAAGVSPVRPSETPLPPRAASDRRETADKFNRMFEEQLDDGVRVGGLGSDM